jgi:uncharacterized membrane protein (UPF0127 family)
MWNSGTGEIGLSRTRTGVLGLLALALALATTLLAACDDDALSAEDVAADTPAAAMAPIAIAPAQRVPPGLDDDLALPADVESITFDYTEVEVERSEGEAIRLGMLVADTIERRTRGLMHRQGLQEGVGMLFAFPVETGSPFWNLDTPMEIEIAFLDEGGVVQEILWLEAEDPTLVRPELEYLYAVEMPAGWWRANRVRLGDRVVVPAGVEGLAE